MVNDKTAGADCQMMCSVIELRGTATCCYNGVAAVDLCGALEIFNGQPILGKQSKFPDQGPPEQASIYQFNGEEEM
jgi:hypothetical protein